MDSSPPDTSVRGISQERVLEWVAISFFRRPSQPTSPTLAGRIFTWATRETHVPRPAVLKYKATLCWAFSLVVMLLFSPSLLGKQGFLIGCWLLWIKDRQRLKSFFFCLLRISIKPLPQEHSMINLITNLVPIKPQINSKAKFQVWPNKYISVILDKANFRFWGKYFVLNHKTQKEISYLETKQLFRNGQTIMQNSVSDLIKKKKKVTNFPC